MIDNSGVNLSASQNGPVNCLSLLSFGDFNVFCDTFLEMPIKALAASAVSPKLSITSTALDIKSIPGNNEAPSLPKPFNAVIALSLFCLSLIVDNNFETSPQVITSGSSFKPIIFLILVISSFKFS